MMRRRFSILFLLAALSAVTNAAGLPSAWRSWRYSRAIADFSLGAGNPVAIQLPWELFSRSNSHGADFRIIDDYGQEIPYFLAVAKAESQTETRPSQIMERSFVPGQFTQIVIRVTGKPPLGGTHGVTHKQLDAEPCFNTYRVITPESDFMYWVETAVSDDAHEWRIIDAKSPISRFHKHGLDGNQTVQFEGYSNQRFLRLRIMDPDSQFPVDGVEVLSRNLFEPPRSPFSAVFSPEKFPDALQSSWQTDLSTPNLPVSELDFATSQSEFFRALRVSTSEEGKEWSFRAAGEIYRFHQSGKLRESLRIDFPETFARFWRVDIVDGNDRPLADVHLEIRGLERRVTFRAEPGHTYRLLYGNDRALPAQYDFARIFDPSDKKVLSLAQLGSEEPTSNYADPRPYTERHPNLLWLALGVAVALLGYAALRALRTPGSASP
jgi:uncharacterized protein DUF3999